MGALKDMLERAVRENNLLDESTTDARHLFDSYEHKFKRMTGQLFIWKTHQNPNLKHPQLVVVEKPYKNFVLVKKAVFNSDGIESVLRYGVNYSSLFVGHDTMESLEVDL